MFQLDERLRQRFFRPTFRIGFLGVDEEAIVGREDIGEQRGEFGCGYEFGGLGYEEVIAMSERLAQLLDLSGIRRTANLQSFA